MAENCVVMGVNGKLKIDGNRYQFIRYVSKTVRLVADNGPIAIDGEFDPHADSQQNSIQLVGCQIYMQPSIAEMEALIPLIFPDNPSAGVYTSGSSVASFTTVIGYSSTAHSLTGCKINRAVFSGQKGTSAIDLMLEIYGTSEAEDAAHNFGANVTGLGYVFTEGSLSLRSSTRNFDQFSLDYNRNLYRDFNNSVTATCIVPSGNSITFATSNNYVAGTPDNTDLYWTEKTGAGAAGSLVFTRASSSLTFEFATLKGLSAAPSIQGKDKPIKLPNNYLVRKTDSNEAIEVTIA